MKFYFSLLSLFIIVLLVGVQIIYSLAASTEKLTGNFDQISAAIENQDWNTAKKHFSFTKEQWGKNKTWWAMVIDHHEIDNIDTSFARIDEYLKYHNTALSAGELSVLKQFLEHIPETEKICLKNIF